MQHWFDAVINIFRYLQKGDHVLMKENLKSPSTTNRCKTFFLNTIQVYISLESTNALHSIYFDSMIFDIFGIF